VSAEKYLTIVNFAYVAVDILNLKRAPVLCKLNNEYAMNFL